MSSIVQTAETQLSKLRWALGLSGALSIALAAVIIIWPGISLYAFVLLFGAFALAEGIIGLAAASNTSTSKSRGWLVLSSLTSLAVGAIVFLNTDISALVLLALIAAYALIVGLTELTVAIGGKRIAHNLAQRQLTALKPHTTR